MNEELNHSQGKEDAPLRRRIRTLVANVRQYWANYILGSLLIYCLGSMVAPLLVGQSQRPDWLLVYLTGIYAIISFYMALGAVVSARAAQDSVSLMQATLDSYERTRQIEHSEALSFAKGYVLTKRDDAHYFIRLNNLKGKAIRLLQVYAWLTETDRNGTEVLKYSSMIESEIMDVPVGEINLAIQLTTSQETDKGKYTLSQIALDRFKEVFNRDNPRESLCMITYFSAVDDRLRILVYELKVEEAWTVV